MDTTQDAGMEIAIVGVVIGPVVALVLALAVFGAV